MTASSSESGTLQLDGRQSRGKRIFLLCAGLFCIVAPTWELRRAFLDPGWWTVFFGIIVAGAYAVGGAFVLSAIAGSGLHWTFKDGKLTIERSSPLRKRTETIRGKDVARTEIRRIDWDSQADTFSVILHLKTGQTLETPDFRSEAGARSLEAEIVRRLGINSPAR